MNDVFSISTHCTPDSAVRVCSFSVIYHPLEKKEPVTSIVYEDIAGAFHPLFPILVRVLSSARAVHFSGLCTPQAGYTIKVSATVSDMGRLNASAVLSKGGAVVEFPELSENNKNLLMQATNQVCLDIIGSAGKQ